MIVISDRAWHLRLVRLLAEDYTPRDLCSHFWRVVGMLLLLPGFLVLSTLLVVTTAPVAVPVWFIRRRRKNAPPSLIGTYLSAKKRKVCPLIEVRAAEERGAK